MSVASRIRDKLKNNLESSGGHSVVTSGTKVIRYRAGQRPDYAETEDDQDSHFSNIQNQKSIKEAEINDPRLARFKNRSSNQDEPLQSMEERKASRRRHHDTTSDNDNDTTTPTTTTNTRRIQRTEIIKEDDNDNNNNKKDNEDDNNGEDDDGDRRKRAKERYLKKKEEEEQRQKELEEKQQPFKDVEESEEEEEGSSEYETDSEEDDDNDNEYWNQQPIFRPTFIKKDDRGTIKTDEQWEKEEQDQQAQLEREKEQRKIEAHRKLKDELDRDRKEQEAKDLEQKEEEEYDDDDDEDGSKKLLWIQRELGRVRLEVHNRLLTEFEKKQLERRRTMTDEQILKEDPSRSREKDGEKKQLKFLQRDYHRGAFFQDDEYIKNKDFSAPTGEDKFNRELLPKVMQVKNFGKAGRTKYTHLKDQDTSDKNSLWNSNYKNKRNDNNNYSNSRDRDYNYRDSRDHNYRS